MMEPPHPRSHPAELLGKTLDSRTIEVLASTVFRTIFRDGLRVPLKVPGLIDLDVAVQDNNVLLNLNQVQASIPQLSIWRITFAFQGRPVVEYGRGIKNDVKFHLPQLFFLWLTIWQEKRRKNRAQARGEAARERAMVSMAVTDLSTREPEETVA